MEINSYIKYTVSSSDSIKYANENGSLIIVIPKIVVFENYNIAFKISSEILEDTWVLHPVSPNDIGYMTFMLNDPIILKSIFGVPISRGKKYKVLKSKISSLPIPKSDDSLVSYYSLLEMLFQEVYNNHEKSDMRLLMLDIFSSIRLALSFELHQYNIMKEANISIFENWKKTIDNIGKDLNKIFEELLSPDNELLNNVRRFQLLLGKIQKSIQDEMAAE